MLAISFEVWICSIIPIDADGLVAESCPTLATPWTVAFQAPSGKNTGVGCHSLLQGIFLTQELNPGLLHCRQILYQLSYKGSQLGNLNFSPEMSQRKKSFRHAI